MSSLSIISDRRREEEIEMKMWPTLPLQHQKAMSRDPSLADIC